MGSDSGLVNGQWAGQWAVGLPMSMGSGLAIFCFHTKANVNGHFLCLLANGQCFPWLYMQSLCREVMQSTYAALRKRSAVQAANGQQVPASVRDALVTCRKLGRPARSGAWQCCVTINDWTAVQWAAAEIWTWWATVSEDVDPRGWRMVAAKWYTP